MSSHGITRPLANRAVIHSACGSRGLLFLLILHLLFLPSLFLILLPGNVSFGSSFPLGHGHYIDYNLPCAGVISESAVSLSRTEDWSHLGSGRLVRLGYLFIYLITYAYVCMDGCGGRWGNTVDTWTAWGEGGCKTGVVMVAPAVVSYKCAVGSEYVVVDSGTRAEKVARLVRPSSVLHGPSFSFLFRRG